MLGLGIAGLMVGTILCGIAVSCLLYEDLGGWAFGVIVGWLTLVSAVVIVAGP